MATQDTTLGLVGKLYDELQKRRPDVETLNGYYRGKQPLRFASEKWKAFHSERYAGFSDNWCAPVADAPAERQHLNGVRSSEATEKMSREENILWSDWLRNEGDQQLSQGLLQSGIASRSFALVYPRDDGDPGLSWESPSQVIVSYDPERRGHRRAALKTWVDDSSEFSVLYTPQSVHKFQRRSPQRSSGLILTSSGGGGATAGGKWSHVETVRNAFGVVPIVEFPNRPMLNGEPLSDIRGTKAMQDAINLLWAYLFGAADHASFPARVVMGQERPKVPVIDDKGQQVGERNVDLPDLERGRFLWLTGENTKIGQWDSAKLDVFTSVIEIAIGHIAAQTRTPPHYLSANKGLSNLSGDALKAAETGLVKKVEEQQLYYSAAIREVFRLMAVLRGMTGIAKSMSTATVQWANAEMRSDSQRADALIKKRDIGYPMRYLLELDGLSPTEIDRVMEMRKEEQSADPLTAATEAIRSNREF